VLNERKPTVADRAMPAPRHPLRRYILSLIKAGKIASLQEAAWIADVERSTVLKWLRGINADLARLRLGEIARLRSRAQLRLERYRSRLSVQGGKRARHEAIRRFNDSNGRD
jgi:hypothetical protein